MGKIQARFILEILGRPKEHVETALSSLIEKISTEKGVLILEKTLHDAIPVKDSKDLFTSFAELTIEVDNLMVYFGIMFAYMPSNTEIIYPESMTLNNFDLNELSHRLIQRLHDYDAIAKRMIMEKNILEAKLKEVAPHLFKQDSQKPSEINDKKQVKKSKKKRN